jgi:rfaE bifunctional protein kinase chain/domain
VIATRTELESLLARIGQARVAIVGDFCLDAYWIADMTRSELSRETPHHPLPIVSERYAPGAAGNVAMNVQALGVARAGVFTVLGDDWRGRELRAALSSAGLELKQVVDDARWSTPAYIKPIRRGYASEQEDARLDFGNYEPLPSPVELELIERLRANLDAYDAWLICDQLDCGVITPHVRQALLDLAAGHPRKVFVADARKRIGAYTGMAVKPNELELAAALGRPLAAGAREIEVLGEMGSELAARLGRTTFVTVGERGVLVCTRSSRAHVPGVQVAPPVDTVGAGDSFLAALGSALGAGASDVEAAAVANLAASVTVRKLQQTGTASPGEIQAAYDSWRRDTL